MKKKTDIVNDYDKEEDILFCGWGQSESSLEFFDGRLVLDFDKNGNVVGFEFFDFGKALKESIKINNKIFKNMEKKKSR